MTGRLTRATLQGAGWAYASSAANAVASIAVIAVLARMLVPQQFGLVAMAQLVLHFASFAARWGVGQSLINRSELTPGHVRAGVGISLGSGLLMAGVLALGAPLVGVLFRDQSVVPVVRVMGLFFVGSGLGEVSSALLRRDLRFRALALSELLSYLIGYALVAITLATRGWGAWALVAGAVAQPFVAALIAYGFARHPLGVSLHIRPYRELLGYGVPVTLAGVLEFVAYSLSPVAVGRLLGPAALGILTNARKLSEDSTNRLITGMTKALFPSMSRVKEHDGRFGSGFRMTYLVSALLVLPFSAGLAVAAPEVVSLVLGPNWAGAVPVMRLLCLGAGIDILQHVLGVTVEARGEVALRVRLEIVFVAAMLVLVAAGARFGLTGIVAGYVLAEFVHWATHLYAVARIGVVPLAAAGSLQVRPVLNAAAVGLVTAGSRWAALRAHAGPGVTLSCEIVAALAGFAVVTLAAPGRLGRSTYADILDRLFAERRVPTLVEGYVRWLRSAA